MSDDARLRVACHEAAHAVAAHLLDREVLLVSLTGPLGRPCSIDRPHLEPLNGRGRRSGPPWYWVETEIVIVLAGDIGEALADEATTAPEAALAGPARRVPDPPPIPPTVPRPVVWQAPLEAEPEWPTVHFSDRDQAELLVRSITSSDAEHEALMHALRLRTEAFVRHRHFAFLWRHLVDRLLREPSGELLASEVKHELGVGPEQVV
jgi:hypothetical protein